jgi:hypothetical protein
MNEPTTVGHGNERTALTPEDRELFQTLLAFVNQMGRGTVGVRVDEKDLQFFEVHMTVKIPSRRKFEHLRGRKYTSHIAVIAIRWRTRERQHLK